MIKLQIIGNLGHDNKLFSKTCPRCGGIFEHGGASVCPQCQNTLVDIAAQNGRKMMVSEGTIYPLKTKEQQDREEQSIAKRRNAMPTTFRFVILSFGDAENNVVNPPKIHPYLTTGRQVIIEINHAPIVSWFKANDGTIKCEIRLGIMYNGGDTIRLLGKKEAAHNQILPEEPARVLPEEPAQASFGAQLTTLQKQLSDMVAAENARTAKAGAPNASQDMMAVEAETEVDIF